MVRDESPLALPADPAVRIAALDILRGLALLGMLVVHFHVRTSEPGGIDEIVRTAIWRLVESKSHGTFALLFGAGFAIQLRRARERGGPFAARYLRRLAVLALFGFAAHALFGFNVLLGYAVWGVPLLLIRDWSTRRLLLTAGIATISVPLYQLVAAWYLQSLAGPDGAAAVLETRRAAAVAVNGALHAAEAQESPAALLAARLDHMAWFHAQPFFFLPNATLALFIAGLLLVRHRAFEDVAARGPLLVAMAAFGVAAWSADNWLLPSWGVESYGLPRDQWLMFAYVSGALWLLAHRPGLAAHLGWIARAGRMALTNYLLQIAALDLVFSAYALGVGSIRPVVGFASALGCFAVQAALSTIWLRHYRFGPAEWLWRSLTYGRLQPMRPAIPAGSSAPG